MKQKKPARIGLLLRRKALNHDVQCHVVHPVNKAFSIADKVKMLDLRVHGNLAFEKSH